MELINETFVVKEIDMIPTKINNVLVKVKNKIFSKVSRIFAVSFTGKKEITIDINTEIYEIHEEDRLEILILKVKSKNILNADQGNKDWIGFFGKEILDLYEYVMHGTIFHSGQDGKNFFIYASFGGLLMKIFGNLEVNLFNELKIDSNILILIRKI